MKTIELPPSSDTISLSRVYWLLDRITVKKTTTINGIVVTRWAFDRFELGTFGKTSVSTHEAADALVAELPAALA